MVFFTEVLVFGQFSWIVLFGTKRAYLHPVNLKFQEASFAKSNSVLKGNNVLDASASNTDGFLWRDALVFQLDWISLFGTKSAYVLPPNLCCRKYSFQNLTQFLQGNNVIHALASDTDSFLSTDTCVSSTELNRRIWNKICLSPLWKL